MKKANHQDIYIRLKELYGEKCSLCGSRNVPLEIEHIVPLVAGGGEDLNNLALVCRNCNSIRDYRLFHGVELVQYLAVLLKRHKSYRNIVTEAAFEMPRRYRADIMGEENIKGNWKKIIIEVKVFSTFTKNRIKFIIAQLLKFREYYGKDVKLIFAFPGTLPENDYKIFKDFDIEVWDQNFIASRFKKEVEKTPYPIIQHFLSRIKKYTSEEEKLIDDLKNINPGKKEWSEYQKLIGVILDKIFCPPLSPSIPELSDEFKINKRDFILPNYAKSGFWVYIRDRYVADFIVIDAKNYSKKIQKKEVLQIANYLKAHGPGLFGIIITRNGGDRSCNLTTREVWATEKKLIIILDDEDIVKMLVAKLSGNDPEEIIKQKIEEFRLSM